MKVIKVKVISPWAWLMLGVQLAGLLLTVIFYWYDYTQLGFITVETEKLVKTAEFIFMLDLMYCLGASCGFTKTKEVYYYPDQDKQA
jgi:hypothetical protein